MGAHCHRGWKRNALGTASVPSPEDSNGGTPPSENTAKTRAGSGPQHRAAARARHCLDPFWLVSVPAEHFRDVLNVILFRHLKDSGALYGVM